jgi:(1->4)-alpha-D-glucan 1-alpha-D-glucosylmutase
MTQIPAIPRATYRIQFNKDFTFADAERITPYLARLGVSHVYASPYLKARSGSTHGYDIVDHNAFNPEIGDEAAFVSFSDALNRHGLGQILDFVPNHVGIGRADNVWWLDVLEWGEESPYAEYFDIEWNSPQLELRHKVLVPFLGDHYGRVLEAGDLKLGFDADSGSFSMWYYEQRLPITPGEYSRILRSILGDYRRGQPEDETVIELEDLLVGFRDLGDWSQAIRQPAMRRTEAERLRREWKDLVGRTPALAEAIEHTLARLNGRPADREILLWIHELLEAQHYRLAYWRVAAEEINYRRFFQINELAGIRIELPTVFEATHRLVLELIRQRRIHGLRIDHIDGLFDPKQYLERLQRRAREVLAPPGLAPDPNAERPLEQSTEPAPEEMTEHTDADLFFVVVEKILAAHEHLREDWPIAGTTGYDFLNRVHGLFVDPQGEAPLRRIYERFIGEPVSFEETAYVSKRQVMDFELASELRVLANEYNRLTESSWLTRDYTLVGLRQALREVVACFPVYRTYVNASGASPQDRRDIEWAVKHARRRSVRADKTVFDFIHAALTTDLSSGSSPYNRREVRRLAMKFQQYTGPVAAKGVEDTAFYRYNRLVANNEVGGEPTRFGITVSAFHKITQDAARRWPHAMLSTATHDTKRGEDARMRIDVLSEIPTEWGRHVRRWATLNHRRKVIVNDEPAPTANDEYLLYQTLVGSWPMEFHDEGDLEPQAVASFRERIFTYMIKAVREAKTHSSWINPNSEYEDALLSLVGRCLDISRANPFLADFRDFHRQIAVAGMLNSLSQAVLKLTAPGIPDIYQGCELWDLNLVDPDNRRPVDFSDREQRLARIHDAFKQQGSGLAPELLRQWQDGTIKLFITWRLLSLRREHASLFEQASYTPVEPEGERADHVCSFLRGDGTTQVLTVAPRLTHGLLAIGEASPLGERVWGDTSLLLPSGGQQQWVDLFTGLPLTAQDVADDRRRIAIKDAFSVFPVSVLVHNSQVPGVLDTFAGEG